jgi:hypothetical protein
MLYFNRGIGGCTGHCHFLHYFIIRYIITHKQHLAPVKLMLLQVFGQLAFFIGHLHKYVFDTKTMQSFGNGITGAARYHHHTIALLYSQLQGKPVLDIHTPHKLAIVKNKQRTVCQHAVYIKNESGNMFKLF